MDREDNRALMAKWSNGKRPRSVSSKLVVELRKKLLHELEHDIVPRLVQKEMERTLMSREASALQGGAPLQQITRSPARKFRLQFKTNPSAECYTKSNLQDEHGDALCVFLIDAAMGQPVINGPESLAKLEVVPLMGHFNTSEEQEWSAEEFEKHVAKQRDGKPSLLFGDLEVRLKDGVGKLGQMQFTDNSRFMHSGTFRLGVRIARDNQFMSVREGKSQAFRVKEDRGKAYEKRDTPSPTDDVWRLHKIRKNGAIHTKSTQHGIKTVKDFLLLHAEKPDFLRSVCNMREKAYQITLDHAMKCNKVHIYPVKQPPYEVAGALAQSRFIRPEMIDGIEKVRLDGLVRSAYDRWNTDMTEHTIQDLPELFPSAVPAAAVDTEDMVNVAVAPQLVIDRSYANDMVNAATAPQEAVDASLGTEGVSTLEPITGQGNVDGDAIEEWFFQELIAGVAMENLIQEFSTDEAQLWRVTHGEVATQVQYVMTQIPLVGKWRSAIRCAIFLHRAGFAWSF